MTRRRPSPAVRRRQERVDELTARRILYPVQGRDVIAFRISVPNPPKRRAA